MFYGGKADEDNTFGVLDIDGAFRGSKWQLAYQFARSFENEKGDYAASAGFTNISETWIICSALEQLGIILMLIRLDMCPGREH